MSTRTLRSTRQVFGGYASIDRRFTTGSLNPATATQEVEHFVRRRRRSSIGGAA